MEILCLKEFYLDFPYLLASSGPFPMDAFYCYLLPSLGWICFSCPAPKQQCSAQPCLQLPLAAQEGKSELSGTPVPSLMAAATVSGSLFSSFLFTFACDSPPGWSCCAILKSV